MTKQCMIQGITFTLSSTETEVEYSGRRLSPHYVRSLSFREKDLIRQAVDTLAALTTKGSVLKKMYSSMW